MKILKKGGGGGGGSREKGGGGNEIHAPCACDTGRQLEDTCCMNIYQKLAVKIKSLFKWI
jgi:hypothetical protein